ncbi:Uncharacterized protein QTN25_001497 [Entamoeba marina]
MLSSTPVYDSFDFTKQLFINKKPIPLTLSLNTPFAKTTFNFPMATMSNSFKTNSFSFETATQPTFSSTIRTQRNSLQINETTKGVQFKTTTTQPKYSICMNTFFENKSFETTTFGIVYNIHKNTFLGINYLIPSSKKGLLKDDTSNNQEVIKQSTQEDNFIRKHLAMGYNARGFVSYHKSNTSKYSIYFDCNETLIGYRLLKEMYSITFALDAHFDFQHKKLNGQVMATKQLKDIGKCKLVINTKKPSIYSNYSSNLPNMYQ